MLDLVQTPQTPIEGLTLLFALMIGHALADYPLQGEYIALHKNRHHKAAPGEKEIPGLWVHCLTAHSLIHAGFVWLITGRVVFGVMELVLHFLFDTLKCDRKTTLHTDQLLHLLCKSVYVLAIMRGWVQ
jgi:hypothetical protein